MNIAVYPQAKKVSLETSSQLTPEQAKTVLERAQTEAQKAGLPYAGSVTPIEAWQLAQLGVAVIVDVRSAEERKFVGQVPKTIGVQWASGTSLTRNPRFLKELENKTGKETVVLLLCRSGKRSALAAESATKAGFTNVFNILNGFEGDLDEHGQRRKLNGWQVEQLPWIQD